MSDDFTSEQTTLIETSIKRGLKKIYSGNYQGEFPQEFWDITSNVLNNAVDTEFGASTGSVALLKNQLKYQNGVFSAFKSTQQTQTLNNLLAASKAATFADFETEVLSTVNEYNINHLKAEWRAAKSASRSAKRWAKAVEDSDLFPNIIYLESIAKTPRDKHKPYYGMILAMDDPLLDSILPPSDWGCMCGWSTTDKPVTGKPKNAPPAEPGLDNNPGKDGAAFSQSHPYFKTKGAANIVKSNIAAIYDIDPGDINEFYWDPKTKGCYFSVDKLAKIEAKGNKRIAKAFAQKGHIVELHGQEHIDSIIDNRWNEFKTVSNTVNSIDQAFRKANKQFKSRNLKGDITLELPDKYQKGTIQNALKDRANRKDFISNIEHVHFIHKTKYLGSCTFNDLKTGKLPL